MKIPFMKSEDDKEERERAFLMEAYERGVIDEFELRRGMENVDFKRTQFRKVL